MTQEGCRKPGEILVATALKIEKRALLAALAGQFSQGAGLDIEVIGCGPQKVEERLPSLLKRLKPSALFFIGAAGWLGDPEQFRPGKAWLIENAQLENSDSETDQLPAQYADSDSNLLEEAQRLTQLPVASVVTVDEAVMSREVRERLARTHRVDLVDMETYHLYRLAAELGIPAVALRVTTDLADENADRAFHKNLEQAFRCIASQIVAIVRQSRK